MIIRKAYKFRLETTATQVARLAVLCGHARFVWNHGLRYCLDKLDAGEKIPSGSKAGIQAKHERKFRVQLAAIDTATIVDDIDFPGFKLHSLRGDRDGIWSITVNGNWRITFEFVDGNAYILNYEDYH